MSFSPLDGLAMATRCGALDPAVVLYLCSGRQKSRRDRGPALSPIGSHRRLRNQRRRAHAHRERPSARPRGSGSVHLSRSHRDRVVWRERSTVSTDLCSQPGSASARRRSAPRLCARRGLACATTANSRRDPHRRAGPPNRRSRSSRQTKAIIGRHIPDCRQPIPQRRLLRSPNSLRGALRSVQRLTFTSAALPRSRPRLRRVR